jgi:Zn-dependent protease
MSQLLIIAASIAGAWLALQLIVVISVLVQILRLPLRPTRLLLDAPAPPLPPDQQATLDELQALGFEPYWLGLQQVGDDRSHAAAVLRHRERPAFASVIFISSAFGGYNTAFHSFDAQGRRLVTTNRIGWLSFVEEEADVLQADPCADSLPAHWQAHEARLGAACATAPEDAFERIRHDYDQAFERLRRADTLVQDGDAWHPRLRIALRITRRWFALRRRLMRPFACAATSPEHRAAYLAHCHEQHDAELQRRPPRHNLKATLLIGSLAISLAVWSAVFDWRQALALVAVLLVHEMGHAIAMRAFGWKDMSMFFIPFMGAIVTGQPRETAAWKQAVSLLAGPLPGLIAGVAALAWASRAPDPGFVSNVALMAITINLFNLLPITPLDGGQLVDIALFSRWPRLRAAFAAASVAGFALLAYKLDSPNVLVILFFIVISMQSQWRIALVQQHWQPGLAPREQLQHLYAQVLQRWPRVASARQLAIVRAAMKQRLIQLPRWWESLIVAAVLAAVWGTAAPYAIAAFWPEKSAARPHRDARTVAQRAFDEAWSAYEDKDEPEDAKAALSVLAQRAEALAQDDPRHFDLEVARAQAADEPEERRRRIGALVGGPVDGHEWKRTHVLSSELRHVVVDGFDLDPPRRIERYTRGIAWAEQVAPAALAPTIDLRLRLIEAIDDAGDTDKARPMLVELQRRAETADDCQCELQTVVRARTWFHLSHGETAEALALLEQSAFAGKIREGKGGLAIDHAWALLLDGQVARGSAQMRKALSPPRGERHVRDPLDMAHALLRNGQADEARAMVSQSPWQCRMALEGWEQHERMEPWQRLRDKALQDSARAICPPPAAKPKNLSVNKTPLRCEHKAMDARREPQPRVAPWARVATTQTRFVLATRRAGAGWGVLFTDRF